MVKRQQSIQTSLLVIIITLETFIFVGNIIPVLALHKEQQLLDNYDDQEFADVVKGGDEEMVDMPLQSMKASNIYDDADESLQDCIYLAAKVGDNLADKEAVHCIEDVNFFKNKFSTDSSVPITMTSTTTTGTSAATGNNGTSTFNGISTADADDEENNLINNLVKTGKFTEDEARELVTKVMLINNLVKTGKFTEDEARELVTKVMNNGANVTAAVPEANVTAAVPEANVTAAVPEANVTAAVPEANVTAAVPEANVTAAVPEANVTAAVPEANVTAAVPEANVTAAVPEANVTAAVPEANVTAAVPEANVTAAVPEANVTAAVPEAERNCCCS